MVRLKIVSPSSWRPSTWKAGKRIASSPRTSVFRTLFRTVRSAHVNVYILANVHSNVSSQMYIVLLQLPRTRTCPCLKLYCRLHYGSSVHRMGKGRVLKTTHSRCTVGVQLVYTVCLVYIAMWAAMHRLLVCETLVKQSIFLAKISTQFPYNYRVSTEGFWRLRKIFRSTVLYLMVLVMTLPPWPFSRKLTVKSFPPKAA